MKVGDHWPNILKFAFLPCQSEKVAKPAISFHGFCLRSSEKIFVMAKRALAKLSNIVFKGKIK